MAQRLLFVSFIIVLGLSFLNFWVLLLIVPLLLWYPIAQFVLIRYGQDYANQYFLRDWKGLPQVGEYATMRGHLFLRIPKMTEVYVKPTKVMRIGETTFDVKGSWLKRYRVFLKNEKEGVEFLNRVKSLAE